MIPTPEQLASVPFQYANDVRAGNIVAGKRIRQAVERFFGWIETAEGDGFHLDHGKGMHIIDFFPTFLNHTKGKMAGRPFVLSPFQQFTWYNVMGWIQTERNVRRINTVYDKRAKKNGKTAEMAGAGLYFMSFDMEMEAEVYIGATKEDQARLCWQQAKMFMESPVGNKALGRMGFYAQQRIVGFRKTGSTMRPLGGDSKTQDGINCHFGIVDEYHSHKDDSVKENLESSTVQRLQPLIYHITTAGTNVQSACKMYEDSVIEVLEGRNVDDHLWVMIHDIDAEDLVELDGWENKDVWVKANPLLGDGLDIEGIEKEYIKAVNQRSKVPNFKTKNLNMWVDQPKFWIMNEDWMKCDINYGRDKGEKRLEIPMEKFTRFGSFGGLDLSTTTDLTAYAAVSEPDDDGDRYIKIWFFCPFDTIEKRSKVDRVPYRYWVDQGYIIATPGNVIDYTYIEDKIMETYLDLKIKRLEIDQWNATQVTTNLQEKGINVSYFSQAIGTISAPTKEFEKLVYSGKLKHDGNPVLAWMLAGCQIYRDANDNMKVHKGQSNVNGRRIDGIVAVINCLGGSMSKPEETSKYSKEMGEGEIYV